MKNTLAIVCLLAVSTSSLATQLKKEFAQRAELAGNRQTEELLEKRKDTMLTAIKKIGDTNGVQTIAVDPINDSFAVANAFAKYSDQTICQFTTDIVDTFADCITIEGKKLKFLIDIRGNVKKY